MKHVAVVGASGAVGERMIRLLEERRFPLASINSWHRPESAGRSVNFRGEDSSDPRARRSRHSRASTSFFRARRRASRASGAR